ncbi:uncharacterized protein LOC136026398 isoform X2 [Artemia franciscana]|uniref:Uncharacterized protein n=1 Tax=Artemia franciscana TaxID=6661 RepID=A0AA88HVP2_ARTSF|nr:hypothetical protein QYM36_012554 [Artemia franciscana]
MNILVRTLLVIYASTSVLTLPYNSDIVMSKRELKGILRKIRQQNRVNRRQIGDNCIDCFDDNKNDVFPKSIKYNRALIGRKIFSDLDYLPAYRSGAIKKEMVKKLRKKKKLRKESRKKLKDHMKKGRKGKSGKRRKEKRGGKKKKYEPSTDTIGLGKKKKEDPSQLTSILSLGALSNMRKFFGDIRTRFKSREEMGNDIIQNDAPSSSLEEPQFHLRALRVPESSTTSRRKFEPRFMRIKSLKYDPSFHYAGLG